MNTFIKKILKEGDDSFIGSGVDHYVTRIDNEWVKKTPADEGQEKSFSKHIAMFTKFPDLFAKVRKTGTDESGMPYAEIEYLDQPNSMFHEFSDFIDALTEHDENYEEFMEEGTDTFLSHLLTDVNKLVADAKQINNPVVTKWCTFVLKIKKVFKNKYPDLKPENIGINKSGELKLLDW